MRPKRINLTDGVVIVDYSPVKTCQNMKISIYICRIKINNLWCLIISSIDKYGYVTFATFCYSKLDQPIFHYQKHKTGIRGNTNKLLNSKQQRQDRNKQLKTLI